MNRISARCSVGFSALLMFMLAGTPAGAQDAPMEFEHVPLALDSGVILLGDGGRTGGGVAYTEAVSVPGAAWVRVWFGESVLPDGAELVVTSALSGAVHRLNAETLAQWSSSSAYLAGDTAFVDLVYLGDGPGDGPGDGLGGGIASARVSVVGVDAGLPPIEARSICGPTDDRVLSNDPRASRIAPRGCTAWLFNNRSNSAMTANHCDPRSGDVLWFNVPLRTSTGSAVPPDPEHQYPVDPASVQDSVSSSIGNDWAVFGVFNNSNTGLSPVDAQLDSYLLATEMPPADERPVTIIGYGTTSSPVPRAWNAVQKTHSGPLTSTSGTTIRYRPDTTGGNSGSAVLDATTGRVLGIHTNGGCSSSGTTSSNSGTSIANAGLRAAVMQARGIANGPQGGVIRTLGTRPDQIDPAGGTTIGASMDADFLAPAPQGGLTLHTNDGSGWNSTPMSAGFAGDWFAAFPPTACGSTVSYYFSAIGGDGSAFAFPPSAPAVTLTTISTEPWSIIASADGETDAGWTVENTGVSAGGWARGVPSAADTAGGPNEDADGSGACWTTGLASGVNLNGGPTRLVSPVIDLSGAGEVFADVSLWLSADGSSDRIAVDASTDDGASWQPIDSVGPTPGWSPRSYRVRAFTGDASSVRLRFSIADSGSASTLEAGVDAFVVRSTACGAGACGIVDLALPFGILDLADIQAFVSAFVAQDPAADVAAPLGTWDLADVGAFVGAFIAGCP